MYDEGGNKGVWAGLIVTAVAAVLFLVLWFLRGGDVDKLQANLKSAESAAASATQKLESDLRSAKADAESSARKVADLEKRVRDDARKAGDEAAQLERRLRSEIDGASRRLTEAQRELEQLRAKAGAVPEKEVAALREELRKSKDELAGLRESGAREMARLTADLEGSRARATDLEKRLTDGAAAIARLENELKSSRGAIEAATGAPVRAAESEIAGLKSELSRTSIALAEAKNANAALEEARARLADSMRKCQAEAQARENELRDGMKRLDGELAAATSSAAGKAGDAEEALKRRLEAVNSQFEDFRKRSAVELQASEETWKAQVAALEQQVAALKGQLAEQLQRAAAGAQASEDSWKAQVAALEQQAAALKGRLADLETQVATLEKQLADQAKRSGDAARAADAAWRERLDKAEKENAMARNESDKTLRETQSRLDLVQREYSTFRERAAATAAAAEKAGAERLAKLAAEADAKMAEAEKRHADGLAAARRESARKLSEVTVAGKVEAAGLKRRIGELEKELEATAALFTLGQPGRSVGRIVERLADGQTLLIPFGARQRIRPGMLFDVYRPVGERNRYIGSVRVIRTMEDFSMVVSTYTETDVMVCPATGRAVLEPGARFSPFAAGKDGKPVELKKAGVVGLSLEAPAVGDLIDNPFYDPAKPLAFAIAPDLAGDPCVAKAVDELGGVPRTGATAADRADFLVVKDSAAEAPAGQGGPRRVTLGHVAAYLSPAPVFQASK